MTTPRALAIVAVVLSLAGCSSSDDGGDDATGAATSTSGGAASTVTTEAAASGSDLASVCTLVTADDVETIAGVASELRVEEMAAGPPYDRCSFEASGSVLVSFWTRSLATEGLSTPDEFWERNLPLLEDSMDEVRPLPAFGEYGYLLLDGEGEVGVSWFPSPETLVESEVNVGAFADAPPSQVELQEMAEELASLFDERLAPHLPLPEPAG